jgi:hypothetical protein
MTEIKTRTRPKNRLSGECHRIGEGGFTLFLHVHRAPLPDKSGLGPVASIALSSKTKTGTAFHDLLRSLTAVINRELQVQAIRPGEGT